MESQLAYPFSVYPAIEEKGELWCRGFVLGFLIGSSVWARIVLVNIRSLTGHLNRPYQNDKRTIRMA
jgi:hypothetical protein